MITLLKIAKSSALSLFLSCFLIFAYTVEVQARGFTQPNAADVLPPGGKTIGGPGYWDGGFDHTNQYHIYVGPTASVCATAVNVSTYLMKIVGAERLWNVLPKETQVLCIENTDFFKLGCDAGPGKCKAFWRVDSM